MLRVHLVNNSPQAIPAEDDPLSAVPVKSPGSMGLKWAGKEPVELKTGRRYLFEGRNYTFLGVVARNNIASFIHCLGHGPAGERISLSPDQSVDRHVVRQSPGLPPSTFSGHETQDLLFAFRDGVSFLVASTSRGMSPVASEPIDGEKMRNAGSDVIERSPFPQRMTPQAMAEAAAALGLRAQASVLLVEPIDSQFPIALALCGAHVSVVSRNVELPLPYGHSAEVSLADTTDRTNVELLASDFGAGIAAAGGSLSAKHTSLLIDAERGQFSAAAVNGTGALEPLSLSAVLASVAYSMEAGGRLLLCGQDAEAAGKLLYEAADAVGMSVKKIRDRVPYDVSEAATLYELNPKPTQRPK